jgi:O-antigen/teichoic acid export membrane protein
MKVGLLRATGMYAVASGVNAAIPFLLLPILTRVLSEADYGSVAMFASVMAFASSFTGLSVHGAIAVRFFDRDQARMADYITSCLAILLVSTLVALATVAVLMGPMERLTDLPWRWIVIAVAVSGAQFVLQLRLALWQVAGEPLKYVSLQITQTMLNVGLSLLLVVWAGWMWRGRTGGQSLGILAASLVAMVSLHRGGWLRGRVNRADVTDAMRFGIPLIPHAIGAFLIGMVDRFMITNIVGVAETGVYLVGVQVAMMLALLTEAFNRAWVPWLFGELKIADDARRVRVVRFTYAYFALVLLVAIVIGLVAPTLLGVLVGERFRRAADVILYLAIGQAFVGMYYMVTNYLFYTSRTALLASVTLTSGFVNVLLSYYLIHARQAIGAAQSFMITQVLVFAGTWFLAHRVHPMPWRAALGASR